MNRVVTVDTPHPGTYNALMSAGKHGSLYLNRKSGWTVFRNDMTPFATEVDLWNAVEQHTPKDWNVSYQRRLPI
jgi:hypothetical protein